MRAKFVSPFMLTAMVAIFFGFACGDDDSIGVCDPPAPNCEFDFCCGILVNRGGGEDGLGGSQCIDDPICSSDPCETIGEDPC